MHGGHDTSNQNFTWVAMVITLVGGNARMCTGSVVSENVILTAAHCFTTDLNPASIIVRSYFGDSLKDVRAQSVQIHPDFRDKVCNDMALVTVPKKLSGRIDWGGQVPLKDCVIAGFGETGPTLVYKKPKLKGELKWLFARPISRSICSSRLPAPDAICLPTYLGVGPCVGDSGGPMACGGHLVGVLSRGYIYPANITACGEDYHAMMIYEDVFTHKDWIKSTISNPSSSSAINNDFYSLLMLVTVLNFINSC